MEKLVVERGPRSGRTIIVSIDSTGRGPALGGCRIRTYGSWRDGMDDALRLSAAMTEKAALAGLPHGGGKTVVALEKGAEFDRDDLLTDIAGVIDGFGGGYITGPDVGTGPSDMERIHRLTPYALCRPEAAGGSGDSSGPTALGVTASIEAVCEHLWPGRDLSELSFSLLGLGHVGALVAAYLSGRGARLIAADIDPNRVAATATMVTPAEAFRADVDVLVPCAVGGILTPSTVGDLRCRAIVGPANNQLDDDTTADVLAARGILWAPDTIVSAGGIVSAVARELHGASREEADDRVRAIGPRLGALLRTDAPTPLRAARRTAA
jgi:glutamate dehydrogenase/leucine dehydrogenase